MGKYNRKSNTICSYTSLLTKSATPSGQTSSVEFKVDSESIKKTASVIPEDHQQEPGGTEGKAGGCNRGTYKFKSVERWMFDGRRRESLRGRNEGGIDPPPTPDYQNASRVHSGVSLAP